MSSRTSGLNYPLMIRSWSKTETRPPLNDSQDSPTRDAPPSGTCSPPTGDPDDDGGYLVLHLQYLHRAGKHGTHQLLSCELHTPVFAFTPAVGLDRDHCLTSKQKSYSHHNVRGLRSDIVYSPWRVYRYSSSPCPCGRGHGGLLFVNTAVTTRECIPAAP